MPGRARAGVRILGTAVDGSHAVASDQVERDPDTGEPLPIQAADHVVDVLMAEAAVSVELGLGPRVAVEAVLPLRLVRTEATFLDAGGAELRGYESIHHRDEVLVGPADLELWTRFRLAAPSRRAPWTVDARGGSTLPVGGTEPNPFELGRRGQPHQHVFFGNGTVDALAGLDVARRFDGWSGGAWATGRWSIGDGRHGYHAGSRYAAGLHVGSGFGSKTLSFRAGPEVFHEDAATWDHGREKAKNSGRTDVLASVGASWTGASGTSVEAALKKPFTVRSEGGQISIPVVAIVGFSTTFDVWSEAAAGHDDHDHEHEHSTDAGHGDDAHAHANVEGTGVDGARTPATGDVRDLATGGAGFDPSKAVVPGKVTVIDFWATWCHPCLHIDHALRELAGADPDVAVRRVEVVDDDSESARQHLDRPVTLPVVWVFDRRGTRTARLVATDARAVRAAVLRALQRR